MKPLGWIVAAAFLLAATPALGKHRRIAAPAAGGTPAPATRRDAWQAAAIARATAREQVAPGVTNELAPDAKATATGGPVGGVPGFDGM